jgi:hypothetical protein
MVLSLPSQRGFLGRTYIYKNLKYSMDKLTGRNLGRVFNSRLGHACMDHAIVHITKQSYIKLKTRPKQILGSLPLAFVLPGIAYSGQYQQHCGRNLASYLQGLRFESIPFCWPWRGKNGENYGATTLSIMTLSITTLSLTTNEMRHSA